VKYKLCTSTFISANFYLLMYKLAYCLHGLSAMFYMFCHNRQIQTYKSTHHTCLLCFHLCRCKSFSYIKQYCFKTRLFTSSLKEIFFVPAKIAAKGNTRSQMMALLDKTHHLLLVDLHCDYIRRIRSYSRSRSSKVKILMSSERTCIMRLPISQ